MKKLFAFITILCAVPALANSGNQGRLGETLLWGAMFQQALAPLAPLALGPGRSRTLQGPPLNRSTQPWNGSFAPIGGTRRAARGGPWKADPDAAKNSCVTTLRPPSMGR